MFEVSDAVITTAAILSMYSTTGPSALGRDLDRCALARYAVFYR
jgi:hypothetical protein